MIFGEELKNRMLVLPEYDEQIRGKDEGERLIRLSDLYKIYIPSTMSMEIYSKMYMALLHSLQKKDMKKEMNIQRNANYGIIGGSDSFTIIGCSGIGKSSAIFSSINLLCEGGLIIRENPYMKIIPVLVVQCPFDCSTKGLLLNILREVDNKLGSNFCEQAIKARATIDALISSVSRCCINNIGVLIVDEIQNVVFQKGGSNLVGCLTQLINSSGISIGMVGTPEVSDYFSSAMQLARRSLGLKYSPLEYDDYFVDFCKTVFRYQYVKEKSKIDCGITEWLYEHSGGIISVVVSLLHDAQEIAILGGKEILNLETLNMAYNDRMKMLHKHLNQNIVKPKGTVKKKAYKKEITEEAKKGGENIYELIMESRKDGDVIEVLGDYIKAVI